MNVGDICSHRTVHIPASCTLQEAAVQMRDRHVGALLVTQPLNGGSRAVGVVTDRDMVLDAIAGGLDPCTTPVEAVMSASVVAVERGASVSDAVQTMLSHGVRRLAVREGDALVGVLALDDVVQAMASDVGMVAALLRNAAERERSGVVQPPLRP